MRDRGVAPVEHPQLLAPRVEVSRVEVVMLQRLLDAPGQEFVAQLAKALRKPAQPSSIVVVDRKIVSKEPLIPLR